jgi:hypothetical protein
MAIPPNNNDLQRERNKFLVNSLSFNSIIKRGSVANGSRDNVIPASTPSIPISPSITPTNTLTPSPTLTPTISLTPTLTPTITLTPTVTPTVSITPTISLTPSVTVTATLTPTVTPTITITPSITPTITPTSAPLVTVTENKDFLLLGLDNLILPGAGVFEPLDSVDLKLFNGLYNTKHLNFLENNRTITKLERYNFINNNVSKLTRPIFYVLSGSDVSSSDQTWKLTLSCNGIEVGFIQAPEQYGNTLLMPLCNYFPYDYIDPSQIDYVANSYFTDVFKRPSFATSTALMVRGLTGSYYFSASGSVNGTVLYRDEDIIESSLFTPSQENIVAYYSELFYSFFISPPRWVFITYTIDDTYQIAFSSSSPSNIIPISGFKVDPEYTLQQHLSVVEPGLTLIDIQDSIFQTTPTPTVTPTITPTISPTISLTPTITPTISITPSFTPSNTPTISITPSITPTITIIPTLHPLSSIPTWSTNEILVDDPGYTWTGIYSKPENYLGEWTPGGGDNRLIFDYYLNPGKWALYGDNDYQGPVNSSLNQTVNFIPMQGWPDNIRISIV